MEEEKGYIGLVNSIIGELGYRVDTSDIEIAFWTSHLQEGNEFEIALRYDLIKLGYFHFINYLPIKSGMKIGELGRNRILYFLNEINQRINLGFFYVHPHDDEIVYQYGVKYTGTELTQQIVEKAFNTVVYTPIIYFEAIKLFVSKENWTNEAIEELISNIPPAGASSMSLS